MTPRLPATTERRSVKTGRPPLDALAPFIDALDDYIDAESDLAMGTGPRHPVVLREQYRRAKLARKALLESLRRALARKQRDG